MTDVLVIMLATLGGLVGGAWLIDQVIEAFHR
jgi:hypothetical protein